MLLPRQVHDTNVSISAALQPKGKPAQVLELVLGEGMLVCSKETWDEIASRLMRPRFDRLVSRVARLEFLAALREDAEWVEISGAPQGCRDPADDKVLETALVGKADCIVTGDKDLAAMRPIGEDRSPAKVADTMHRGIAIIRPAEYLWLSSGKP